MTEQEFCDSVSLEEFVRDMHPADKVRMSKEQNPIEYKNIILKEVYRIFMDGIHV